MTIIDNLLERFLILVNKESQNIDDIIVKHVDENHTEFSVRGNF